MSIVIMVHQWMVSTGHYKHNITNDLGEDDILGKI